MEIEVWSVGKAKFTADAEYREPMIREAIDQRGDVADVITDYTDSERSDISHDEYARVTGDIPDLVLFEGWLTGDRNAPPPSGAQAAPELADAMRQARGYRDALERAQRHLKDAALDSQRRVRLALEAVTNGLVGK
jgi:hypothetical protein